MAPLKPRFIHHPQTLVLLLELLADLAGDLEGTYFDVPRMRVATSDNYLNAGVAYVLHPHRDIWYGSPACQLNWWLPVFPFESESSFAFYHRYWSEPVPNIVCRLQPLRVEQGGAGQRRERGQGRHAQAAEGHRAPAVGARPARRVPTGRS